jgi:hypothetical protein
VSPSSLPTASSFLLNISHVAKSSCLLLNNSSDGDNSSISKGNLLKTFTSTSESLRSAPGGSDAGNSPTLRAASISYSDNVSNSRHIRLGSDELMVAEALHAVSSSGALEEYGLREQNQGESSLLATSRNASFIPSSYHNNALFDDISRLSRVSSGLDVLQAIAGQEHEMEIRRSRSGLNFADLQGSYENQDAGSLDVDLRVISHPSAVSHQTLQSRSGRDIKRRYDPEEVFPKSRRLPDASVYGSLLDNDDKKARSKPRPIENINPIEYREMTSAGLPAVSATALSRVKGRARAPKPKMAVALRRGKWTHEEEEFTSVLVETFRNGLLPIADGTTLRTYLSGQLHCAPMRITKKFPKDSSIGKQLYKKKVEGGHANWESLSKKAVERVLSARSSFFESILTKLHIDLKLVIPDPFPPDGIVLQPLYFNDENEDDDDNDGELIKDEGHVEGEQADLSTAALDDLSSDVASSLRENTSSSISGRPRRVVMSTKSEEVLPNRKRTRKSPSMSVDHDQYNNASPDQGNNSANLSETKRDSLSRAAHDPFDQQTGMYIETSPVRSQVGVVSGSMTDMVPQWEHSFNPPISRISSFMSNFDNSQGPPLAYSSSFTKFNTTPSHSDFDSYQHNQGSGLHSTPSMELNDR